MSEQGSAGCAVCTEAARLLEEWRDKQGHDQCWYYPEIFRELAALLGVSGETIPTIDRSTFEDGCRRYQDELYG